MIKFDYVIKRKEGQSIREFRPDQITSPLENVSLIAGENSIGKSTLMNIIALGLFADNSGAKEVNNSLRPQINSLLDFDTQELKFCLKILDNEGNGIIAEKGDFKSKEITRYEINNGTKNLIAAETFFNKYRLIYDIPDNPLDRLKNLAEVVIFQQSTWLNKIVELEDYIRNIITKISEKKNLGNIDDIKKLISDNEEELNGKRDMYNKLEKKLEDKKNYLLYKKLEKAFIDLQSLVKKISEKRREKNNINRIKKENETKLNVKRNTIQSLSREIDRDRNDILSYFKMNPELIKLDNDYKSWLGQVTSNLGDDTNYQRFIKKLNDLERNIEQKKEALSDIQDIAEITFYSKLVEWIKENTYGNNYTIPGLNTTVDNLLSNLMEKIQKTTELNGPKIKAKNNYISILGIIKNIKPKVNTYHELLNEIHTSNNDMPEEQLSISYSKDDYTIYDLEKERVDLKDRVNRFERELGVQNILLETIRTSISKLEIQNQDLIDMDIGDIEIKIKKDIDYQELLHRKITGLQYKQEDQESQKQQIENSPRVPYEEYYAQLKIIFDKLNSLKSNIQNFHNLGNEYIKGTINKYKDSGIQAFFDDMSEYLARRMKTLTHIDKIYNLTKVDIINQKFIVENNITIQFSTMGTGQSQLTYLSNKLNYDGRKILAIFDEVSTMSNKTRAELVKKMVQLNSAGTRLLMGIMVFPSSETKTIGGSKFLEGGA